MSGFAVSVFGVGSWGGLVVAGGVDGQVAEKFAGGGVDDADVQVADEQEDAGSGVGPADADVAEVAAGAQGDGAVGVDDVGADPVVGVGGAVAGGGFGPGCIGGGGGGPVRQGSVGPAGVVVGGEGIQEGLELGEGGGLVWLGGQPSVQGLPEPLDLALGLRVVRAAVLLGGAEPAQLVLEGVAAAAAAGKARGVDHAVIGQRGGRDAVAGAGGAEGLQHDRAGDPLVRGQVQHEPGMVIEPADDLGVGTGASAWPGEPVVGEVRLPALAGQLGLESDVGGLRSFPRLRDDQPGRGQVAADRRRRHPDPVLVFQVPADGVRAGIQALPGQFLARPDDQPGGLIADRAG